MYVPCKLPYHMHSVDNPAKYPGIKFDNLQNILTFGKIIWYELQIKYQDTHTSHIACN